MSFAQNLEYLLKENGITRYRFSKLTGYSQTTLANWISGKTTPYSKDREAIAKEFDLTVEELMGDNLPPIRKKKETGSPLIMNSKPVEFDIEAIYRQLSPEAQKQMDQYAQFLLSQQDKQ